MDKGPWKAEKCIRSAGATMVITSGDFHHDVWLDISGDFADWAEKVRYAEWLADTLNRAHPPQNPQL